MNYKVKSPKYCLPHANCPNSICSMTFKELEEKIDVLQEELRKTNEDRMFALEQLANCLRDKK